MNMKETDGTAGTDYAALKKGGFMRQAQRDKFSMRLKVIGGQLSAAQLEAIAAAARRFGKGYVHLTARQGVEVPFIDLKEVEAAKSALAAGGVEAGVCGPRVRTVTACQGAAVCPQAAIETTGLAEELAGRYFGRELPHKFKIGVTGCGNNCLKAEENDLGVKGCLFPEWHGAACNFCGVCGAVCPAGVVALDKENGSFSFDEEKCNCCGKCVKGCPAGALEGRSGYLLSFGGMFGNEVREGRRLIPALFEKEKVFAAADAALGFYEEHGKSGERFGRTIDRVGADALKKRLEEAVK